MEECRAIPNWDVIMTDTGKGTNHSVSASLQKLWDMGVYGDLAFRLAYTYMDSEAVSDALSSTPTSLRKERTGPGASANFGPEK